MLGLHLAGCKKVQQVLANPVELSRFIDPDSVTYSKDAEITDFALLQSVFAGLYSLDQAEYSTRTTDTDKDISATLNPMSYTEVMARAMAGSDKYVMKPQREGGGNNIYNEKVSVQIVF